MQLALAHRSSAVLFAAANLDLFTVLGAGPRTAAEVAAQCNGQPEQTRLLLEACVAEGLLTFNDGTYANTDVTSAFLVRGGPAYSASGFKYAEDLYPAWGQLTSLVRSGRPPMPPETILGQDKEKTRAFVLAMHERARGIGSVLPHVMPLTGRKRLIDVGGGPGTYSVALVQQTPGLTSTVLDVPGVLEVTRELIDASGVADRITLMPGDYLSSPFGTGYDVALLSGMMHRETPADCKKLLTKAFDALDPGGLVIVSDVFFDDDAKRTPAFTVYFALNMMLTSNHGSAHAKTEMAAWMREVGFRDVAMRDLPKPNPHALVIGTKP
ncbi:MAG TPA: methyltransferase [Vicinamibacterales bacterium]|nr:methyltransferase [Vicinamibacterales bacterium]